ncbi:MAG TPA: hypothetical protein VK978_00195 [Candidatus Saccharimonadales bacterium]|nr:hypothetical protein [Candidatus Saccharimonadales bacterium]
MDYTIDISERVDVITRFSTHGDRSNPTAICFPARMRFRGQVIEFTELGLRHPTTKGRRMIHVFDMSDGTNDYRLEFDAEGLTWTLVAILLGQMHQDDLQQELLRIAHNRRTQKRRGGGWHEQR